MSTSVSNTYFVPVNNGVANSQTIDRAGAPTSTVGAGAAAGTAEAPDPVPGLAYGALMASLGPLMPRMSGEQLDVLVASFTEKAKDISDASDKDQIKTQEEAKSAALKQKKANADYAIKKQAEAEDKMKNASVWDKIKLGFEYLGALLTIAAGVATIAAGCLTAETGVGLAAGIIGGSCMIASGVCMLTMAVDSTVQVAQEDQGEGDLGMFGMMCKDIAKSRGMSDDDAEAVGQKGAMGASIALGAMSAAFGLASAGAGGAESVASLVESIGEIAETVAAEAEEGASLASKVVDFTKLALQTAKDAAVESVKGGVRTAKQATESVAGAGKLAAKVGSATVEISSDVSNAGAAAADIGSEVEHYQGQELQVDAKRAQANTKRFEAMQQAFDDAIDLALSHLKASGEAFNQVMDGVLDGLNDRNQTLTSMKFRA